MGKGSNDDHESGERTVTDALADRCIGKKTEDRLDKPLDWRHISCGREIPSETYSDQPYIVKTDDGAWLCTTAGWGMDREFASKRWSTICWK